MPYLNEIVDMINAALATERLQDGSRFTVDLHGISELIQNNLEDTTTTIPVLVNTNDWREFTGFDDRYSVQVYHRVLNIQQVESPLSYGNGNTNGREQTTMRLVCFADRKRTKLSPYELGFIIRSTLNRQFLGASITDYAGLLGVTVEATEDNYNGVDIWQSEYSLPAQDYPVRLHQMLFTIDYTITCDYNNSCITSCLEC